jgi:Heterokaryon incompatibility protein (HET)
MASTYKRIDAVDRLQESALTFSILIWTHTLQKTAREIYEEGMIALHFSVYLFYRFLQDGWCPNQVAMIRHSVPPALQYYLYLLGPPQTGKEHEGCTRSLCRSNQVVDDEYELRHVYTDPGVACRDSCRTCSMWMAIEGSAMPYFGPDITEMTRIIDSGGIPLIRLSHVNLEADRVKPEVVPYKPETGMVYVALSHVWADGLGTPKNNRLPVCQLFRLRKYLALCTKMSKDGCSYLWIDTICIPIEPASARAAAIMSIARIFQEASVTLVYSSDLLQLEAPTTSLECLARLCTSNWMRRLWTLSEAMLSNQISIVFSNQVKSLVDLSNSVKEEKETNPAHDSLGYTKSLLRAFPLLSQIGLKGTVGQRHKVAGSRRLISATANHCLASIKMPASNQIADSRQHQRLNRHSYDDKTLYGTFVLLFLTVLKSLSWRSTSQALDEFICIGQLFGMDLKHLLEVFPSANANMIRLLQYQHVFPSDIILLRGQRIPQAGYKWAPLSFLKDSIRPTDGQRLRISQGFALLSTVGLVFRYPGILLSPCKLLPNPLHHDRSIYYILFPKRRLEEKGADSTVSSGNTATDNDHAYRLTLNTPTTTTTTNPTLQNLAVIVRLSAGLPLCERTAVFGNIVTIRKRAGEIIYADFVAVAEVRRVELGSNVVSSRNVWEKNLDKVEKEHISDMKEVVGPEQAWCLG